MFFFDKQFDVFEAVFIVTFRNILNCAIELYLLISISPSKGIILIRDCSDVRYIELDFAMSMRAILGD